MAAQHCVVRPYRLRPISLALVQTPKAGHAWQMAPEARYRRSGTRVRLLYADERERLSLWTRKAVALLV